MRHEPLAKQIGLVCSRLESNIFKGIRSRTKFKYFQKRFLKAFVTPCLIWVLSRLWGKKRKGRGQLHVQNHCVSSFSTPNMHIPTKLEQTEQCLLSGVSFCRIHSPCIENIVPTNYKIAPHNFFKNTLK